MKEKHIINLLESVSFASLAETDHEQIRAHSADCVDCARAYKVAMVSASLLETRVSDTANLVEPPPFFHTKVLAAIREQRNEIPVFQRLWRTAGALASSMAAAVVLLGALTFMSPDTQSTSVETSSFNAYAAEELILNETEPAQDQVSDAQVLSTLYDDDER